MFDDLAPVDLAPGDLAHAVSFAVVLVAVTGERLWLWARDGDARLRPLAVASALMAGSLVVGSSAAPVLRAIWGGLATHAPTPASSVVGLHPAIALAVGFVAWDLAGFWHHWLGHHVALGWFSHRWHHTGPAYDLSVALRQSWIPWPALVTYPLVALTGVSFTTASVCAAISNTWQALDHTSLRVSGPPWLARWLVTPAVHRMHHESREPVNLGAVLTVWDRLLGTWAPPPDAGDLRAEHAADWTIGDPFRPNNGG